MATLRGGTRIGWMNASMPLARLDVDSDELVLASRLRTVRFAREDVVSIEPLTWVPYLAWGVQIVHARTDIAARVIFWYWKGPDRVLDAIRAEGFVPDAAPGEATARAGGAFRTPFLIAMVLLWNALLLPSVFGMFSEPGTEGRLPFTWTMAAAPAMLVVVSLLILFPTPMRRLALTDHDRVKEVRPLLMFIAGIGTMLAISFTSMLLTQ